MDLLAITVGTALRRARTRLQLTEEEVADCLEVPLSYYRQIEDGHTLPSLPMLTHLSMELDVPVAELIGQTHEDFEVMVSEDTSIC